MNCKNCATSITSDDKFCSSCGGRVINERLTFRHIWKEVLHKVLNIDNKFLKTFWHLIIKPNVVISSYINGVRKRYINPFNFLLIALTVSGVSIFFTRDLAIQEISNMASFNGDNSNENLKSIMNFIYDYNSIFISLLIPFYAIISYIVFFNKRLYNYVEHCIIFVYSQTIYSYLGIITSFFVYVFSVQVTMISSNIVSFLWVIYNTFLLRKLFKLNRKQTIIKFLYFLLILLIVYLIVSIVTGIFILMFFGLEGLKEFAPK